MVLAAVRGERLIEHPLVDKVRACSSNPDKAAFFFTQLLSPIPTWRLSLDVRADPYLVDTFNKMEAYCKSAPLVKLPCDRSLTADDQQSGMTICTHALVCRLLLLLFVIPVLIQLACFCICT